MKAEKTRSWIDGHFCDYSGGISSDEVEKELLELEAKAAKWDSEETQLKLNVAFRKFREEFIYKSIEAVVDGMLKIEKSILEAFEEAKKDGAVK